jgi:hypothetical protein
MESQTEIQSEVCSDDLAGQLAGLGWLVMLLIPELIAIFSKFLLSV